MKYNIALLFLLINTIVFSQENGEADWNYTTQNKLDELANNNYEILSNSLVLTSPCNTDFPSLTTNETLAIGCIYDLNGATITLPENVTLDYRGGDIINGNLVFNSGIIDGRLLNASLAVTGEVVLKDPVFKFIPSRWEIVEGETTSEQALLNVNLFEDIFTMVKEFEGHTVEIDQFDAYFEVSLVTSTATNQNFYPSLEAVNIPADFNLIMSDDTHLRVFPNENPSYNLLAIREASNVTITGGNLHGDRLDHIFTDGGTHEKGHLMHMHAAANIIIDGLRMFYANGDGMKIDSLYFTFQEDKYVPSNNILIKNCLFDSNRRNNLSITDGFNIVVEDNEFLNAGKDLDGSEGTAPKFAIDIEAHRERDDNGDIIYYERAYDIIIRNNVESGSVEGGFAVYIGEDVTIEDNVLESKISWSYTTGTIIRNNTLTANPNGLLNAGILGGRTDNVATTYGNEVYGNTIEGYDSGITIYTRENKVYDNIIKNCVSGIFLRNLQDSEIYNNTITSNVDSSKGIFANITTLDNVAIYDNEIDVITNPYKFSSVNTDNSDFEFIVRDNIFNSIGEAVISNCTGLNFNQNTVNVNTSIYDSNNLVFSDNTISSQSSTAIHLRNVNTGITLDSNTINVASNATCIKIDSTTDVNEVTQLNNACILE